MTIVFFFNTNLIRGEINKIIVQFYHAIVIPCICSYTCQYIFAGSQLSYIIDFNKRFKSVNTINRQLYTRVLYIMCLTS